MQRRQITLEDGRYLIFYTFEGEAVLSPPAAVAEAAGTPPQHAEPEARPEAEEERSV